ncbi:MAG: hypothetical protein SFW09_09415 [Hyphomicrobiaceae bacterium]|nr:hypothetical protein [Hyphomicrobiaceae bacterium]
MKKGVQNSSSLNVYSSIFRICNHLFNVKNSAASTMEMTAVMKTVRWGASACVAALALALNCGVASAQLQKAPETKAEPAKKEAAKPATPAKKAAAPKCNDLKEEAACGAGPGCQWVAASKTKAGKEIKAYCRTAPKAKAKPAAKAPAKADAPAKAPAKADAPAKAKAEPKKN